VVQVDVGGGIEAGESQVGLGFEVFDPGTVVRRKAEEIMGWWMQVVEK
jgi:hypothetical protein